MSINCGEQWEKRKQEQLEEDLRLYEKRKHEEEKRELSRENSNLQYSMGLIISIGALIAFLFLMYKI